MQLWMVVGVGLVVGALVAVGVAGVRVGGEAVGAMLMIEGLKR